MKILFIGDIVGKMGRRCVRELVPLIRKELGLDLVVANAENVAGGSGITPDTARELLTAEVDVLTSGDHTFKKKEVKEALEKMDVLRPLNYGEFAWGRGYLIKTVKNINVAIINLMGRVFMEAVDCPFKVVRDVLEGIKEKANVILVDMHAEATSEKLAMGFFLASQVTAVVGTHTHIPTADERIIEGFTAYITDVGMTGSFDSILGREKHCVIQRFITNMPTKFNLAQQDLRMQAVCIEVDETTGRALSIRRVEKKL